ncbi:MAG: TIGR03086 family metal-binding protein [Streptosporangiaceae bacterium]
MAPLTRGLELLGWAISYALASTRLATPQRLSCPTPCAGWDLGLLLHHVSDSVGVLHEAIATGCIGAGPAAGDEGPDPDPASGLYRRAGRLLAACAPAGPAAAAGHLITIGDRELAAKMVVAAGAIEITVHGWDISVACGSRRPVPPDLAALLLPIAPLFITPGTRAGLFADPVPVPGRACPGDQLVAFLGRQPRAGTAAIPAGPSGQPI